MTQPESSDVAEPASAAPASNSRRVYIKSFGCQRNVYDAQRMADITAAQGYSETQALDDADLVVLDARATPAMAHRMETVRTLDEELFLLMTLGDDRAVTQTYVMGAPAKRRLAPQAETR